MTWADAVKAVFWIVSMGAPLFLSAGTFDWRGACVTGWSRAYGEPAPPMARAGRSALGHRLPRPPYPARSKIFELQGSNGMSRRSFGAGLMKEPARALSIAAHIEKLLLEIASRSAWVST